MTTCLQQRTDLPCKVDTLPYLKKPIIFFVLLLAFFSTNLLAQNTTTIRGRVTSGDTALTGVTVQVEGTTRAILTNDDGRYSINAPANGALVFSYVGFIAQTIRIEGRSSIDVKMISSGQQLNDVVVVGYGTQRRATISGAVSSINSETLLETPAVTTSGALVGKVQGITARAPDSRPGAGVNIQIRNMGTPLFVIDGVPADAGQFNQLGIADVENISILKDASAAIYGLQAANGVVLVTTKRGKSGKAQINLSGYQGYQNFTRSPTPPDAATYLRGLATSNQNLRLQNPANLTAEEIAKWEAGTEKGYQSYDYHKHMFRPNVPQTYLNASASGGGQNSRYYLSVSHIDQQALIKDFNFNRTNIQANIEAGLAKGLKVSTQISGRYEKRRQAGVPGLDDYFNPFLTVFSMWPTERPYANDNPAYVNGAVHSVNVNPATYNMDVTGYTRDDWRAMKSIFSVEYALPFGLSAKATYQYNYTINVVDEFEYRYPAYVYDPPTATTPENYRTVQGNDNPWRRKIRQNIENDFSQLQLNYNTKIGEHSIGVTAAYERQQNKAENTEARGLPQNNTVELMYFADMNVYNNGFNEIARAGYVGRVNYNYKQKYIVEALGRYDGSYLYAKGQRYGLFPGASVAWRITEENFFRNSGVSRSFNELKFRASYGQTGAEIGANPFAFLQGYNFAQGNAVFNGVLTTGVAPTGLPNTLLTWVTNTNKNIGLDWAILRNKLSGQVDVFERKRTGLPGPRTDILLPQEVGYVLPNQNLDAADAIRGVEGIITYANTTRGGFQYTVSANATVARGRSLYAYRPRFENSWHEYRTSTEDRWQNVNFGYIVSGRFQSQEDIDNHPINNDGQGNRTQLPGDLIYEDVNGDKIINGLDERPIGYAQGAQPYMSFGINSNYSYKGISFQLDFSGATMQTFARSVELQIPFQNNGAGVGYLISDAWQRADPFDPNSPWRPGTYPAVRKDQPNHNNYSRPNNFWRRNVSYVRLRNIEVAYDFPKAWLGKANISGLRVYVHGTNIFSIDNTKEFQTDPEISSEGGLVYPQQKLFTFGFNLNL
ncbi:SusC/RagA family TonB-linked outer membrane protein [Segetibacter sp. 3557_3]|uniref:SusC/RagA family TonB-linked outer membrane protein n=1 Tax=Segetibacter sp. 3557_3 TaxID=2547429 RepID=UPI0010591BAC|nr:SusC/RagA family TonB-linked outer membrane protein [Segetibacter sp. 3557_3]TDH29066.1 SusC/RagA family TonB-linked outer membrane protein [Segetibacter sp. 3557_3]